MVGVYTSTHISCH